MDRASPDALSVEVSRSDCDTLASRNVELIRDATTTLMGVAASRSIDDDLDAAEQQKLDAAIVLLFEVSATTFVRHAMVEEVISGSNGSVQG